MHLDGQLHFIYISISVRPMHRHEGAYIPCRSEHRPMEMANRRTAIVTLRGVTLGMVIVAGGLLMGCPPTQTTPSPPTLTWSVKTTNAAGTVLNVPIVEGAASVDPTETFQVILFADSPSGISAMTLKGVGNVNCQARVSAQPHSPTQQFQLSTLDLGTQNETVNPPATPHAVTLSFNQNPPEDVAVVRCSPNLTTVNGVLRFFDAWSGTLTFTGSASDTATPPDSVPGQLIINLAPPTP
jgi:hypothetical protein